MKINEFLNKLNEDNYSGMNIREFVESFSEEKDTNGYNGGKWLSYESMEKIFSEGKSEANRLDDLYIFSSGKSQYILWRPQGYTGVGGGMCVSGVILIPAKKFKQDQEEFGRSWAMNQDSYLNTDWFSDLAGKLSKEGTKSREKQLRYKEVKFVEKISFEDFMK